MKCKYCKEKEKLWWKNNDTIKCAFENWEDFNEDNWNCWLLDYFREYLNDNYIWNNDQYAWLIPYEVKNKDNYDFWYIYLEWYKSRWKTEKCIDMENNKSLTLSKAYLIVEELKLKNSD